MRYPKQSYPRAYTFLFPAVLAREYFFFCRRPEPCRAGYMVGRFAATMSLALRQQSGYKNSVCIYSISSTVILRYQVG